MAVGGVARGVSFREANRVLQMTRDRSEQFSECHDILGQLDDVLEVLLSWLFPVHY